MRRFQRNRFNRSRTPWGVVAMFIVVGVIAVSMMVYTVKVYHDCEGPVVKNNFDIPVCTDDFGRKP